VPWIALAQSFDAHVDRGQRGARVYGEARGHGALRQGGRLRRFAGRDDGRGTFDKPMALFNVGGEVSPSTAVCPHRGGPLANGRLDGHHRRLPVHG